jgi:hypothetical protein
MLKAKNIIDNKFWILEGDDGARVGTVSAKDNKWTAVVGEERATFDDVEQLKARYSVSFNAKRSRDKSADKPQVNEVYGFPTAHLPHNALWHVSKRLPIYTKTAKSNSYHCAGYYVIRFENGWVKSYCPKLITIQRYEFKGPFKTKLEMLDQLRKAD